LRARPVQQLLSACTAEALQAAALRLTAHLRCHPSLPLVDVAYTLACGRRTFEHRAVLF
jgi:acyl transferase domain-containing protein